MSDNNDSLRTNFNTHRFRVGEFACTAIDDGGLTYGPPMFPEPANFLFADAPKEELDRVLTEHKIDLDEWKEFTSPYTCPADRDG